MSFFDLYLDLGFSHIIDFAGYDHILFIVTLCGVYMLKQWKSVLILVTAFTIGHTITLALATLQIVMLPINLIEFLIPVTIFITCLTNILYKKTEFSPRLHLIKYFTALIFGLIHGLGFSNYLRSLLGMEDSIIMPLFAFNVGLELGQIAIVLSILLISFVLINYLKVSRRVWNVVISTLGGIVSLYLIIERIDGL